MPSYSLTPPAPSTCNAATTLFVRANPFLKSLTNRSSFISTISAVTSNRESNREQRERLPQATLRLQCNSAPPAVLTPSLRHRSTSAHCFWAAIVFPGHTEFLAHLSNSEEFAMAFVAANLRIVLLSTHVPLAEAIRLVQRDRIMRTIHLTHRELKRWGIERPRLAVAALNPHGAEGGLFGIEEAVEIAPAVEACHGTDE